MTELVRNSDEPNSVSSTVAKFYHKFYHETEVRDPDRIIARLNSACILVFVIDALGTNEGIPKPLPSVEQRVQKSSRRHRSDKPFGKKLTTPVENVAYDTSCSIKHRMYLF